MKQGVACDTEYEDGMASCPRCQSSSWVQPAYQGQQASERPVRRGPIVPLGVKFVGVVYLLMAAALVVLVLLVLLSNRRPSSANIWSALVLSGITAFLGFGLLRLKRWALLAVVVLTSIDLVVALIEVVLLIQGFGEAGTYPYFRCGLDVVVLI